MLDVTLGHGKEPRCVLLIGAHCDDIEIGCGGTILEMVDRWPGTRFVWVAVCSGGDRAAETQAAAAAFLAGANNPSVRIGTFRGSYLPYDGAAVKDFFETLKSEAPDLIFTHYRMDLHQDHRVVNELTWNTFRNHLILEYEIPKFDGDLGIPNVFVPLTRAQLRRKADVLLECFPSQRSRDWFTRDTFEAIARLRGVECKALEGYAEAFYGRKLSLAF